MQKKLTFAVLMLACIVFDCGPRNGKQELESFPVGQNVLFKTSTLVANTKADYDNLRKDSLNYQPPLLITLGRAYYVEPQTRGIVLHQQDDTVHVLITTGSRNGYKCWTSKQSVTKVFPILRPTFIVPLRNQLLPDYAAAHGLIGKMFQERN